MANVNDTVRTSIIAFPGLFRSRADVVNFILFTIGNGFEWVDGEPVAIFDEYTPWSREAADAKFELFWEQIGFTPTEFDRQGNKERNDELQHVVNTVDERVTSLVLQEDTIIRDDSTYILAAKAPENITQDWAAALAEILTVRASH